MLSPVETLLQPSVRPAAHSAKPPKKRWYDPGKAIDLMDGVRRILKSKDGAAISPLAAPHLDRRHIRLSAWHAERDTRLIAAAQTPARSHAAQYRKLQIQAAGRRPCLPDCTQPKAASRETKHSELIPMPAHLARAWSLVARAEPSSVNYLPSSSLRDSGFTTTFSPSLSSLRAQWPQ